MTEKRCETELHAGALARQRVESYRKYEAPATAVTAPGSDRPRRVDMTDTSATPRRIQRQRTKGWRMPEGAVYVGRPTIYGNPFEVVQLPCGCWENRDDNDVTYMHSYPIHELGHPAISKREAVENSVRLFYQDLTQWLGGRIELQEGLAEGLTKLRGRDLACWCPIDQPCHADVLLDIANGGDA